ncbi:MAG TPA: Maf family protein [Oscillospiraceae bacterium]|nr:Maf family protein [Oscillospiraceae bacterium]
MLLLASASPRRRELLTQIGLQFTVIPSNVDETVAPGTPPEQMVAQLARKKALSILESYPQDTVLAADTVVAFESRVLGKPKSEEDAKAMLHLLSGRQHTVYTGFCICHGNEIHCEVQQTLVEFYPLSDFEIDDYVQTGEPMDKAGAYGIQGRGALLVKKIDGDFYNVMGLPIGRINRILCNFQTDTENFYKK